MGGRECLPLSPAFIKFMVESIDIAKQKAEAGDKGAARRAREMAMGVVDLRTSIKGTTPECNTPPEG